MPKMKTHSSAKKRFKVTGSGKVKYKQAYSRHMMMNKPKSMKRKARGTDVMIPGDARLVLRNFLTNWRKRRKKAKRLSSDAANATVEKTNKSNKGGK